MMSIRRWTAVIVAAAILMVIATGLGVLETPSDTFDADPVQVAEPSPSPSVSPSSPELPEGDLRSALADLCTDNGLEPDGDDWSAEDRVEAFNEQKRYLSGRLSGSTSAEHLHVAALLEIDAASRIELLERALSLNPGDAFLLWSAVHICAEERDASACPLRDWERRLLMFDGQNSESWVRIAANRYQAGETEAALEAMRHAGTAAETRAYWTETIEMIERGFAAGTDYAFPERAGRAFNLAASNLPRYGDYLRMCRDQSVNSVDWAYACSAYGELVERQGKTDMGVQIARSIQKFALEALGETEQAVAVEQRLEDYRKQPKWGDNYVVTERLIVTRPTLFSAWLAAVRTHGESGARAYLAAEISRLLQQQPELACES